jgi:hypothetical protein
MAEPIGNVYPTLIPEYDEDADIQAALRLYHYGTTASDVTEQDLPEDSVAGYLKSLQSQIEAATSAGIGSEASLVLPTGVPDGFIWADVASSANIVANTSTALYEDEPPVSSESTPLVDGTLWVDKNSSPLTMYVYDSVLGWREIGA